MEYYAVLNMCNTSTPELATRVLTDPQDAGRMWQPSKELAIQYAQRRLRGMLIAGLDNLKWSLEQDSKDHSKSALDCASQLTILTLKLTALVHLAIANNAE